MMKKTEENKGFIIQETEINDILSKKIAVTRHKSGTYWQRHGH